MLFSACMKENIILLTFILLFGMVDLLWFGAGKSGEMYLDTAEDRVGNTV